MDEGNAALYAAVIGFAAALIGAAVGGWASWRAAKHSADAAVWVWQPTRFAFSAPTASTPQLGCSSNPPMRRGTPFASGRGRWLEAPQV